MLANLLPGVRDFRAPLAAGFIWLLALYLAFEPWVPSSNEATGIWASLQTLKDELSAIGAGVALSFVAYVLGSISESFVGALLALRRLPQRRRRGQISVMGLSIGGIGEGGLGPASEQPLIGSKGVAALDDVAGQCADAFTSALQQKETTLRELITPIQVWATTARRFQEFWRHSSLYATPWSPPGTSAIRTFRMISMHEGSGMACAPSLGAQSWRSLT